MLDLVDSPKRGPILNRAIGTELGRDSRRTTDETDETELIALPPLHNRSDQRRLSSSSLRLGSTMASKSQRQSEAEVRSWGFPRVFTWADGP